MPHMLVVRSRGERLGSTRPADARLSAPAQGDLRQISADSCRRQHVSLASAHVAALDERFARVAPAITLESLDALARRVVQALGNERTAVADEMARLTRLVEDRFKDFNRNWPAEAGGLDATMASADD